MPYKDKPVEKLYYTIGEVSEELDVNVSLVRFWAGKFPDFIKPARNKKGNRLFTAKDMANFKVIYYLVKEQGMTLEGAAKRMKERGMTLEGAARRMKDNITGDDRRVEVISRLSAIKEKLVAISKELDKKHLNEDEEGEGI